MKLLIAALALLSFVATSTLPEAVMAQTSTDQTQNPPAGTSMGAPKTTHHKHAMSKKKSSTKKHTKKKPAKKKHTHHKRKTKTKKPATSTNPS